MIYKRNFRSKESFLRIKLLILPFICIGEWTRSVRESVQTRLENQLNNKEIKIENGKIRLILFKFLYILLKKNAGN